MTLFKNRRDAGRRLSYALKELSLEPDSLVLGLPRGGVVVAAEIAKELHLTLDVIAPRKIGAPGNPEYAIGAIAGDVVVIQQEAAADEEYLRRAVAAEKEEAKRRLALYRKGKPPPSFEGKTVVVVDDGIATGATMLASLRYLKQAKAKRRIAAVPVAPPESLPKMQKEDGEIVVLYTPSVFFAVGQFYEEFEQTSDDEVIALLSLSGANP